VQGQQVELVANQEILSDMAWVKPLHGKGRIDWAGQHLADNNESYWANLDFSQISVFDNLYAYDQAIAIVNNWRAAHSYPLQTMKMTLKRRAKKICPSTIVAQRLKRLASIKLKLKLSKEAGYHPNLSQMQDIGGCRAVMETVPQVKRLEKAFSEASKKNPHRGPQYFKTSDYIAKPKENGYRGVHLVYKFRTDSAMHSCYNNQRIEIQLRSKLQHYWATAVETYSTFTGEALKSNIGSDQWKRFFALVSSTIAITEKSPAVPGTPATMLEIVPELRELYINLNVFRVLSGWSAATKWTKDQTDKSIQEAGMYLLVLNPDSFSVAVTAYDKDALPAANLHYAKIEKEQPNLQAVLVSVDSLAALRTAYPNYFLDTNSFITLVTKAIEHGK
jgi:ppGpp synthetase/RelA/SpoT-type nucleotidyltranferase